MSEQRGGTLLGLSSGACLILGRVRADSRPSPGSRSKALTLPEPWTTSSGRAPPQFAAAAGVRDTARLCAVKIAVCVKQVPDATSVRRIDAATNRLDRSGEGALNATDVNAVEEALRIKEAHGGEVVVVSLGPAKAVDSLRKALAMGADRALLVSDDAAAGSDLVATSYVAREGARARGGRPRPLRPAVVATPTAPFSGPPSPTGCGAP